MEFRLRDGALPHHRERSPASADPRPRRPAPPGHRRSEPSGTVFVEAAARSPETARAAERRAMNRVSPIPSRSPNDRQRGGDEWDARAPGRPGAAAGRPRATMHAVANQEAPGRSATERTLSRPFAPNRRRDCWFAAKCTADSGATRPGGDATAHPTRRARRRLRPRRTAAEPPRLNGWETVRRRSGPPRRRSSTDCFRVGIRPFGLRTNFCATPLSTSAVPLRRGPPRCPLRRGRPRAGRTRPRTSPR